MRSYRDVLGQRTPDTHRNHATPGRRSSHWTPKGRETTTRNSLGRRMGRCSTKRTCPPPRRCSAPQPSKSTEPTARRTAAVRSTDDGGDDGGAGTGRGTGTAEVRSRTPAAAVRCRSTAEENRGAGSRRRTALGRRECSGTAAAGRRSSERGLRTGCLRVPEGLGCRRVVLAAAGLGERVRSNRPLPIPGDPIDTNSVNFTIVI